MQKSFLGPIFIVGMPRSGTKLLRELLNSHSQITIPSGETEFLPYWVNNWSSYGDLSDKKAFDRFYDRALALPYFIYVKEQDALIDKQRWYESCSDFSPEGVFEALIRHDTGVSQESGKIWGDKSPSYINQVALLKSLYPYGRFIHIIRDVRDYCLSMHRAWGKNPIRAAQRWVEGTSRVNRDAAVFNNDYLQIRYEDILSSPELTLKKCCQLLQVDFEADMLQISNNTENIGAATGYRFVKQDNKQKYLKYMKPQMRQRIEKIAGEQLHKYGYQTNYLQEPQRVSPWEMNVYKALDAINLTKFELSERGLWESIAINWKRFNVSGNRN